MNEAKAKQIGLNFTGCYNSDKEVVKAEAKRIRKLGFNAYVVTNRASKLSRGQRSGITGWSVYTCERYCAFKSLERLKERKNAIPSRLEQAKIDYQNAVKEIREDETVINDEIAVNNQKLMRIWNSDTRQYESYL